MRATVKDRNPVPPLGDVGSAQGTIEIQLGQIMRTLTSNHQEVCARLDKIETVLEISNCGEAAVTSLSGGQVPLALRSIPVVSCKEI